MIQGLELVWPWCLGCKGLLVATTLVSQSWPYTQDVFGWINNTWITLDAVIRNLLRIMSIWSDNTTAVIAIGRHMMDFFCVWLALRWSWDLMVKHLGVESRHKLVIIILKLIRLYDWKIAMLWIKLLVLYYILVYTIVCFTSIFSILLKNTCVYKWWSIDFLVIRVDFGLFKFIRRQEPFSNLFSFEVTRNLLEFVWQLGIHFSLA